MANLLPIGKTTYVVKDIRFDNIDQNIIYAKFKDGRITGLLIEHLYDYVYRNVTRSGDEGTSYDLFVRNGNSTLHYQSKVAVWRQPSDAFDLAPSYMKGKGRKYDKEQMLAIHNALDGYVLTDLSELPKLTIWTLPSPALINCIGEKSAKVKIRDCDQLVEGLLRASTCSTTQAA
jgi:hypothetical protein